MLKNLSEILKPENSVASAVVIKANSLEEKWARNMNTHVRLYENVCKRD